MSEAEQRRRRARLPRFGATAALIATGGLLAACAGMPSAPQLAMPALPKVEMPDVKIPDVKMPKLTLPKGIGPPVGSPTEVYTRIARGAMLCWFGANGPLKGKYIYHADAEPPSKGGRAEIGIHVIDKEAQSPRGMRIYKIGIEPEGNAVKLTVENTRLPEGLAQRLWEDAHRWAATEEPNVPCNDDPIDEGWSADAAPPATAVAPAGKKAAKSSKKAAGT